MGRERYRTGQLVHLLIACLAVTLSGCATLDESGSRVTQKADTKLEAKVRVEKEEDVRAKSAARHIALAKKLFEQGEIDSSIKESQKALIMSGRNSPGDEALFTMGLACIHPKNPKKDYERSMALFVRMIREYPHSALAEQARTWVDVLHVIEKLKKVDIEIEEKKKELSK
ncbi:MAG: hypothetical protein LLF86_04350 [Nitrospiraceae bacterium]|nr:hypothetical protein [Nitrospiraceae bacterium]